MKRDGHVTKSPDASADHVHVDTAMWMLCPELMIQAQTGEGSNQIPLIMFVCSLCANSVFDSHNETGAVSTA